MADWVDANRPATLSSQEGVPDNHVITIRERRVSVDFPTLIQHNVRTDTVTLDLDSEWDGINPVIIFTSMGRSTSVIYMGEPAFIPPQVMTNEGTVDVSVMGYDSLGEVRLVTVDAPSMFTVVKSGAYDGTTAEEASPDLLGQLVNAATNANQAADAANTAAETAATAAKTATDATTAANIAAEAANTAANKANTAAETVTAATTAATEATEAANTAAEAANTATEAANTATEAADTAASAATSSADKADTAATKATDAATSATNAANAANTATSAAKTATSAATSAASNANTQATKAENAYEALAPIIADVGVSGNQPRKTLNGEVVTADDAWTARPLGLTVHGKTRKNLWPSFSGTRSGMTVTTNEDGSISLSGQCTYENEVIEGAYSYAFVPGKTYTISVDSYNENIDGFFLYPSRDLGLGGVYVGGSSSNGKLSTSYTVPQESKYVRMGVQINKNDSPFSATFRVMLNEGETAEPWCPPGLNSVGAISGSKQNMIESFGGSSNGITATENADGTLSLIGEPETNAMFQIGTVSPLESGKQYTISVDTPIAHEYVSGSSGACLYLNVPSSDGGYGSDHIFGFGSTLSTTFTVPDNVTLTTLRISCIAHQDVTGTYKVMLNEGSTATPWAPPGKKPTSVNLVTAGKNLSRYTDHTFTRSANYIFIYEGNLPFGKYKTSFVRDSKQFDGLVVAIVATKKSGGLIYSSQEVLDIKEDISNVYIAVNGIPEGDTYTLTNIQLEVGSTATEYEPPNVTITPIDLMGHELCSVGDIRDSISVVDGYIRKKVGIFEGFDDPASDGRVIEEDYYRMDFDRNVVLHGEQTYAVCDKLPYHYAEYDGYEHFFLSADTRRICFVVKANDKQGALDRLAELSPKVVAVLNEEETIQLTPTELPELPAPNLTAWANANVQTDISMQYVRDVGIVIDKLEQAVAVAQAGVNLLEVTNG